MEHGVWGAALARGVSDAGQAYIAILFVPPFLVPVIAITALGRWLGDKLRAHKNNDPTRGVKPKCLGDILTKQFRSLHSSAK
jgi:hypothetical protein